MRAKTNSFSASQASVFGAFLRSTSRTCSRHSTSSGACKPMNRAKTWIVANRWFRVAMAHRRLAEAVSDERNRSGGRRMWVGIRRCGWLLVIGHDPDRHVPQVPGLAESLKNDVTERAARV